MSTRLTLDGGDLNSEVMTPRRRVVPTRGGNAARLRRVVSRALSDKIRRRRAEGENVGREAGEQRET